MNKYTFAIVTHYRWPKSEYFGRPERNMNNHETAPRISVYADSESDARKKAEELKPIKHTNVHTPGLMSQQSYYELESIEGKK